MEKLIVENGVGVFPIVAIEIKRNGKVIKNLKDLKILNGGYSDPIHLEPGEYEVTAVFDCLNGKTTQEIKKVTITEGNDSYCSFYHTPSEPQTAIPPIL